MNLAEYLKSRDGRVNRDAPECIRIAAAAQLSPYTVYMIALGHKQASPMAARRLAQATSHVVPAAELRPDVFGAAQ